MELELTPEQQALAESARDFVDVQCPPALVRAVVEGAEGADKQVDDLWSRMVDLDWPALTVPEESGGVGLGAVELAVVCEQLGRVLCPAPFLATAAQYVPAVAEAGTEEQRHQLLGAVAAGQVVGTLAVAEESGRFDVQGVEARWSASPGGFVLSGSKHFVFDAQLANEVVVAARADGSVGEDGIGLFVVPGAGLSRRSTHLIDSSRQLSSIDLSGVEVPAERALGRPGEVGPALVRALEIATLGITAEMVGTSQAIFDIVHRYVGEREQFGVKIGSFQAVKHKVANMFVALQAARATTYFAAAAIAEDDERRRLAVWMAKSSAGDCQKLMAQEGIQNLGGIAYTWEHDMQMFVKRQKEQAALFGTGAEHRASIAAHLGLS